MEISTLFNEFGLKENLKSLCSFLTFSFGVIEFGFLCLNLKKIKTISAAYICAQISIFISSLISRQGIWLVLAVGGFFGVTEMDFGKRILFEVNPWHMKHVLSFTAIAFAGLSLCLKFFRSTSFSHLTLFILLFNILTSRPVLHLSYQLALLVV